jgi:NADH-quinone oxidoreductase subunit A
MPAPYIDVAMFAVSGSAFVLVTLLAGWLLRPHRPYPAKLAPYECGETPIGSAQVKFHIRYYIFALIFLIFEVETIFLYPWAVVCARLGVGALVEAGVFLLLLVVGLLYAARKRVLRWV